MSSQPQVIWYDWGIKCKGRRARNDVVEADMSQIVTGPGSHVEDFRVYPQAVGVQEDTDAVSPGERRVF